MDLVAAEIARKRKAKAELSTLGGVSKYAKRGQKEEAARRALVGTAREGDEDDTNANAVTRSDEVPGTSSTRTDAPEKDAVADDVEPDDDVSRLDETETIRRLRLLGFPATVFGEDEQGRRARLRVAQSSVAVEDEHAGGQQANERKAVMEALAREQRRAREKAGLGMREANGVFGNRGRRDDEDAPREVSDVGPSAGPSHPKPSIAFHETETETETESKLTEAFRIAAARIARDRAESAPSHPADFVVRQFKSLLEEWQREVDGRIAANPNYANTETGRLSASTVRLTAAHLKPLFKKCKRRELPEDLQRALFLIARRVKERDYRAAADAYVGVAIGNAAWPIGVTMVGIHERSARTKINAQTQAHAMHDEETRKFLQGVKRLMTFAQRKFPTAPSLSLDFNSGVNGWDKDALAAEENAVRLASSAPDFAEGVRGGRGERAPALALPDPATRRSRDFADGRSGGASDARTWRSVLRAAYDGIPGEPGAEGEGNGERR
jgi:pre-mRNA-splicing factor 18